MYKTLFAMAILAASHNAGAQEFVYDVEPTHTFVHFEALHSGTSTNRGRFDTVEGTVIFDRNGKKGRVDIVVRPDSVNTGVESYNKHLSNADFLHVDTFPTALFTGDDFVFEGNQLTSSPA